MINFDFVHRGYMRVLGCGFLTFEVFVDGLFRFRVLGLGYWACCFGSVLVCFRKLGLRSSGFVLIKGFRVCVLGFQDEWMCFRSTKYPLMVPIVLVVEFPIHYALNPRPCSTCCGPRRLCKDHARSVPGGAVVKIAVARVEARKVLGFIGVLGFV